MPRETKKGIVLLVIGGYATGILFIKVVLALFHHIKWMLTERCCRSVKKEPVRNEKLSEYWKDSFN
jgi:hypothetical protein